MLTESMQLWCDIADKLSGYPLQRGLGSAHYYNQFDGRKHNSGSVLEWFPDDMQSTAVLHEPRQVQNLL
jgi:hypothetical protein